MCSHEWMSFVAMHPFRRSRQTPEVWKFVYIFEMRAVSRNVSLCLGGCNHKILTYSTARVFRPKHMELVEDYRMWVHGAFTVEEEMQLSFLPLVPRYLFEAHPPPDWQAFRDAGHEHYPIPMLPIRE